MRKLIIFLLTIVVFLNISDVSYASKTYVITAESVNLRSFPESHPDNIIDILHASDQVEILKRIDNWFLVKAGEKVGYVYSDYIGIEAFGTAALVTKKVNFRSGPGTSYKVYDVILPSYIIKVIDTNEAFESWYQVEYNKKFGYISSDYLKLYKIEGESLIGVFTTSFNTGSNQEGRIKNIEKSAGLINSYIISPGEKFSLLDAIGPITQEGGYFLAPEYRKTSEGTDTVIGYGGGVCQLATTLYQSVANAIINGAKIDILERHHHSKSVSYVEDGEDATISWDANRDFCFQNNNLYSIRIHTYVKNGTLSCMIYKVE